MSQVTIDLEDDTLQAAQRAAIRAGLSLSRWFAQFAEAEKSRSSSNLATPIEQHDQALLAQRPIQDWFARTLAQRAVTPAGFTGLSDAESDAARSRYP